MLTVIILVWYLRPLTLKIDKEKLMDEFRRIHKEGLIDYDEKGILYLKEDPDIWIHFVNDEVRIHTKFSDIRFRIEMI